MKATELRNKSNDELKQELLDLLKAQFSLRMQKGTQQLSNTSQLGKVRRDIARVRTLIDGAAIVPVPTPLGRAIGAALAIDTGASARAVSTLSLGPAFSDAEIKRTLDNCRLDYVYEPDWQRVLARASRMLAQGKVQGIFGFSFSLSSSLASRPS